MQEVCPLQLWVLYQCGRGHHFHVECKDKVETFPPSVGESHPGGLAKKLVLAPERSQSFAGASFPTPKWPAVVQNSSLSEQEKEILKQINSQREAESSAIQNFLERPSL